MTTSILTWNVQNRSDGKEQLQYLANHNLYPDILLLQECRFPQHYLSQEQSKALRPYTQWEMNNDGKNKGVAVFTNNLPLKKMPFHKHQGWVLPCEVTLRVGTFITVINVYANQKLTRYVVDTLKPIFNDLAGILDSSSRIILAGDLNVSASYLRKDMEFLEYIREKFELVDCVKKMHGREVPTQRKSRAGNAYQVDYIFASPAQAEKLISCDVQADDEIPSDHFPVYATFED